MKRRALLLIAMLLGLAAQAIPVRHPFMTLTQPDGYSFTVRQIGDEWLHIAMTLDGAAVIKGEDGYYCYARFDADGYRYSTGVHVAPGADATAQSAARNIPWQSLRYLAAARRALQPYALERPNLIRRISAQHPVTKAGNPIQKHGIIILAQFSDIKFKYTKADFDRIINGTDDSTAMAYFNDQFGGKYEFHFDIYGPVTLDNDCKYYGENDRDGNDKRAHEVIIDACEKLKTTVDFSQYDDDGDGEIDNVFVFFAGKDEADDETNNADCIWSHQWFIRDGAGLIYKYNGKYLNNYACTSELMRSTTSNTYKMASIGTFCHEYTHTFGVPDFYDANYAGTGGTADAWWLSLGLMCAANSNNDGHTPPNYNSVERMELGLGEPQKLTTGQSYTLAPIQDSGVFYRIDTDNTDEYYLIECRNNRGWDQYLQGKGLLIYHIDRSGRSTGVDDNGKSCTARERWESLNRVNAWPEHQCADLVEADISIVGQFANASTYSAIYAMEKRAFWPYNSVKSFSASSSPALSFWSGASSMMSIDDITLSGENVTFKVSGSNSIITVPEPTAVAKTVFQDAVLLTWESSDAIFTGKGYYKYGPSGTLGAEMSVEPYEDGKYAVWIEGLTPSTAYQAQFYFKQQGVSGDKTAGVKFTTGSFKEGAFPYIWLDSASRTTDGQFLTGSKIPLRVWNAPGAKEVKWTFDGSSIGLAKDEWYEVKRAGILSAEVIWEDGSSDIVVKKIIIK